RIVDLPIVTFRSGHFLVGLANSGNHNFVGATIALNYAKSRKAWRGRITLLALLTARARFAAISFRTLRPLRTLRTNGPLFPLGTPWPGLVRDVVTPAHEQG